MIALYKYSFSDYGGNEVKECKATQIQEDETIKGLFIRFNVGNSTRTNEKIIIIPDIEETREKEKINF